MNTLIKKLNSLIDTLIFFIGGLCLSPVIVYALFKKEPSRSSNQERILLQLFPSTISFLQETGKDNILYTDLKGYFSKVITVFFSQDCTEKTILDPSPRHHFIQMSQNPENILKKIGLKKTNGLISQCRLFFLLSRAVREYRVTLIKSFDPFLFGINAFFLSRLTGIPYMIHIVQNYDLSSRSLRKVAFTPFLFPFVEQVIERYLLTHAAFVTSSYYNYRYYAISHGASPARTYALQTGVEPIHFTSIGERQDLTQSLGLQGFKKVLYVGRLHQIKYSDDLIRCAAEIKNNFQDFRLLLAGDGEQRPELERLAAELGIDDKVLFLGLKTQEELIHLYFTADVILFTHAGMTLVEAALSGKPIVSYEHDWSSEFLSYNERGLLADFRDYRGMAQKVLWVFQHEEEALAIGEKARACALENFSEEQIFKREREVHEKFFLEAEIPENKL